MHLNVQASLKGIYRLRVFNREGVLTQEITTENTFCKGILTVLSTSSNGYYLSQLRFGSGTTAPTADDTALTSQLWAITVDDVVPAIVNNSVTESQTTYTCTIEASSSYVGTIAEIGIYGDSNLCSHSLLKDSEGSVITIEKTENDTILVEFTLIFSISPSSPFKVTTPNVITPLIDSVTFSYWFLYCLRPYYAGTNNNYSLVGLFAYIAKSNCLGVVGTAFTTNGAMLFTVSTTSHTLTYSGTIRLLATEGDTGFYKYLFLNAYTHATSGAYNGNHRGNLYLDLTDETSLAIYTIEDMSVGTGDGITTAFEVPLSYFIADTDVVYKNEVALTRGTDYTIDSNNNHDCYPELMDVETAKCTGVSSPLYTTSACTYIQLIPESITASNSLSYMPYLDSDYYCLGMEYATPMVIDWGSAVSCNTLKGSFYYLNTDSLTLEYSTDGITYTAVQSISLTSTSVSTRYTQEIDITFTEVSARYWRFSISLYNSSYTERCSGSFVGATLFLGHSVSNSLVFTTAPADGDIITMDANLDKPFKNENFAIDLALAITITFSSST